MFRCGNSSSFERVFQVLMVLFSTVTNRRIMHRFVSLHSSILPVSRVYPHRVFSAATYSESDKLHPYIVLETLADSSPLIISLVKCPDKEDFLRSEEVIVAKLRENGWIGAEELAIMEEGKGSNRFNLFLGGRIAGKNAMHVGSKEVAFEKSSILKNSLGAPVFPMPWTGSISHKNSFASAAVIPEHVGTVGIDVERTSNKAADKLQRRLLTDNEQLSIGTVVRNIEEDVMLRFSFKEAVFKAVNPHLKRYVDFKEVSIFPKVDNTAEIIFHFNDNKEDQALCKHYLAQWHRLNEEYFITSVIIFKK